MLQETARLEILISKLAVEETSTYNRHKLALSLWFVLTKPFRNMAHGPVDDIRLLIILKMVCIVFPNELFVLGGYRLIVTFGCKWVHTSIGVNDQSWLVELRNSLYR